VPITISINSGKDFEPVSEGVHAAVLADVVDKGMVQTAFGEKHKVQFTYLTDEADEGGRTKYVFQSFTASLHEKATLRKAVKAIRGGKDIEGDSFDVESLIGSQVQLVVQHNEGRDGKVYANVASILKPKAGVKVAVPSDFTRSKDKAPKVGGGTAAAKAILAPATKAPAPITDEDIPF
jgi:hypothetical protein